MYNEGAIFHPCSLKDKTPGYEPGATGSIPVKGYTVYGVVR